MSRDGRIATNQGLLREVNDRIEEVSQQFSNGDPEPNDAEADFLCECGHNDCTESVRMTISEYEDVRREEALFVVFPQHEEDAVEEVVQRFERYTVVRKHPEEAAIAEATDPHRH